MWRERKTALIALAKWTAALAVVAAIALSLPAIKKISGGGSVDRIRILFPYLNRLEILDPAQINFSAAAVLVSNIYDALVNFDRNGKIVSGLASSVDWHGERLYLKFRKDVKTVTGKAIGPEDAYLSLKRLMVKGKNTHGNLQNFLCPDVKMQTMEDNCEGLSFAEDELILTVKDKKKRKFLVPLLASPDFRIIPKGAVDWSSQDLKIQTYRETSSLYYYDLALEGGRKLFRVNPNHYRYSEKRAKEIELIPAKRGMVEKFLLEGKADVVTTSGPLTTKEKIALKENSDFHYHQTAAIHLLSLCFLPKTINKVSKEDRLNLGRIVKSVFKKAFAESTTYQTTTEFFPVFGEGGLEENKKESIRKMWAAEKPKPLSRKFVFSVENVRVEDFKKLFAEYENIEIIPMTGPSWIDDEKYPEDGFIVHGDTGFFENISLLSYYLSTGLFGMTREESVEWIEKYMEVEDRKERLSQLRSLHYDFLSAVNVVPIAVKPYVAVSRKPWKANLYKYFAGTKFWMIETESLIGF